MMNLLQVQDDLKNFSQDQLVKEMQQPSGSTPQFLVLSELNRRKRVKGNFEARQAQNQPTVAEEAVASAGVPQSGMMGMSEAMAPQSAVSEGVGTSAPMKMASGGLAQFGNEIREGMGQEIDPYLDGVQQEAESKFNVDLNNNQIGLVQQLPGSIYSGHRGPGSPGTMGPIQQLPVPRMPTFNPGMGGKGMPRPAVISDMRRRFTFNDADGGRRYAEGGVIRAADGLRSYKDRMSDGDFFDYLTPVENEEDDTRFDRVAKGADRILDAGGNLIPYLGNRIVGAGESVYDFFTDPIGPDEKQTKVNEKDSLEEENAVIGDGNQNIVPSPKLNLTSGDENKTLSIEEELLKRQAGLDKSRNFDKYMALAQAGLGILASEKPTLAGAIGEGGMQGLDAFNAANKRYEEGITDILNARSKIQQARIAAGAKGKLTRSGAIQALNTFTTSISSKEKLISDIMKNSYNSPSDEQKNEIAALRESIKDLEFQKSQLFGEAKIRPRPSINVGKLPSTQKAS